MLTIPEHVIIILAAFSAFAVRDYFGGWARIIPRLWVIGFYLIVWFDIGDLSRPLLAALSRYGLALIFLSDIIPAVVAWFQRRRGIKYVVTG